MSNHRSEVAAGRRIKPGAITVYLCNHNHPFMVLGPHVLCRCRPGGGVIMAKSREHCPCEHRGYKYSHDHPDGTVGYVYDHVSFLVCGCRSSVKRQSTAPGRSALRAAEAAYLVGGPAAAAEMLGLATTGAIIDAGHYVEDHGLPLDFPAGK